jgi:hypothetical protein
MNMYTKNGRVLQVKGNFIYSRSGKVIGRINNNKVYNEKGKYVGTIVNNLILVYRQTDSTSIGSLFSTSNIAGTALSNSAGFLISGEEPNIPE